MDNRNIPTPQEAREELALRQLERKSNNDLPTKEEAIDELKRRGKYREPSFKDNLMSQIKSSAESPGVNAILGMGDELTSLLSAGFINPKSGEGTAYNVGNIAGFVAPSLVAEPIVAGSKALSVIKSPWLRKMIASALTTGTQTALQTPGARPEAGAIGGAAGAGITGLTQLASKLSPLLGAPLRAALGGGLGYELGDKTGLGSGKGAAAGASAGAFAPLLIPALSKRLGEKAALEGVDLSAANPRLAASRRLGLSYLTPAEATGSPFVGANQGAVGRTGEGSKLMYDKSQERLGSERKSIKNLLNDVYNPAIDDPQVKSLYKKSFQHAMPPNLVEQAKQSSSIIKSAFDKVSKDPIYQDKLKGIPENNFEYLDQVKRAMDDMRQTALNSGEKDKARLIKQQLDAMKGIMDNINPEYKAARELSERGIARNSIERKMNDKDIRGTNFYNKFLKNDNQFEKLNNSLRNVPGAQQKLQDMRLVFQDLINPRTVKTAFGKTEHGMEQGRNPINAMQDFINGLNGRRYDTAFIELITNPKWDKEFSRIMGMSNKRERAITFANLLSKASAYGISEALKNQSEANKEASE